MLVGVLVHFTWAVRGVEAERKLEGGWVEGLNLNPAVGELAKSGKWLVM
jgi:hypothetical protein